MSSPIKQQRRSLALSKGLKTKSQVPSDFLGSTKSSTMNGLYLPFVAEVNSPVKSSNVQRRARVYSPANINVTRRIPQQNQRQITSQKQRQRTVKRVLEEQQDWNIEEESLSVNTPVKKTESSRLDNPRF